jgi:3-dehydroquinate dehydratase-1
MICVSLREADPAELLAALDGLELVEIRLEALEPLPADLRSLFARAGATVATMRPGRHDDELRAATMIAAIHAGASYVDVELDAPAVLRDTVIAAARRRGCRVIVSHHDHQRTPSSDELALLVDACFEAGADLAKLACQVRAPAEAARLLSLLDDPRPVIPIGMGELGRPTRVIAPLLGAPFTYAALARGRETADGQYDAARLAELLEGVRGG